jgi:AraC-like DNA-binding protein
MIYSLKKALIVNNLKLKSQAMYFSKNDTMTLILTKVQDNVIHSHYAVQFTLAISQTFSITINGQTLKKTVHISPVMQPHCLHANDEVLVLLINPASELGYWISYQEDNDNLFTVAEKIRAEVIVYQTQSTVDIDLLLTIELILKQAMRDKPLKNVVMDRRIAKAIRLLEQNTPLITPLDTIASHVLLSPSRFIHVFKQETAISYRRFQLWLRLLSSIDLLAQTYSITLVAHQSGFADSAHYSRTFKECFGYTPNEFRKMK